MQVTFEDVIRLAIVVMGIWGFAKVIMEIVKAVTARHDREQKWDDMANSMNTARENIISKYDSKLAEMEKKIDENHAETESRLQEIGAGMYMHTMVLNAVLDGLIQLNCNGNVTKAKHDLDEYMAKQAYDMK